MDIRLHLFIEHRTLTKDSTFYGNKPKSFIRGTEWAKMRHRRKKCCPAAGGFPTAAPGGQRSYGGSRAKSTAEGAAGRSLSAGCEFIPGWEPSTGRFDGGCSGARDFYSWRNRCAIQPDKCCFRAAVENVGWAYRDFSILAAAGKRAR
jgi:hypothetical protein